MKILYISRSYPPTKGGMEKYAFELFNALKLKFTIFPILNKKGKKNIPIFFVYAIFRSLYLIRKEKIEIVILTDSVVSPIGYLIKIIFPKIKIVSIALGLDITNKQIFYQWLIIKSIKKFDLIVAISKATYEECKKRGFKNIEIITPGINTKQLLTESIKAPNLKDIYPDLINKKILLSVGRIVKRKGFLWFAENVAPKLEPDYIYVVIGEDKNNYLKNYSFGKNVIFLGSQPDNIVHSFCQNKNTIAFIMPNILIDGDMEGFGIVAIEAGIFNMPVIASNIEGMKDSVIDNRTGYLVEESNPDAFISAIKNIDKINKTEINKIVESKFDWQIITGQWEQKLSELKK